jgi:hypothetical protein
MGVIMEQKEQLWLENRICASISDDFYLDRDEEKRIKEEGTAKGLSVKEIELILRIELDKIGAISERILLGDLDRLLHQFTDNDKELDGKEERDALDKVLLPSVGKKVGLDNRVAEEYVASFCKVNGVRRNSDVKKWALPLVSCVVLALFVIVVYFFVQMMVVKEPMIEKIVETKVIDPTIVILNEKDKREIDDLLRRAEQFVEKAQYTDPPEKSAKASLDQIKQIDPKSQYRGNEVKEIFSKIVRHYIELAKKSFDAGDVTNARKWLERAKLMNVDREVILEKEKALGLVPNDEH